MSAGIYEDLKLPERHFQVFCNMWRTAACDPVEPQRDLIVTAEENISDAATSLLSACRTQSEPSRLFLLVLKEDWAGFSLSWTGGFTSFKAVCDAFCVFVQLNYANIYL